MFTPQYQTYVPLVTMVTSASVSVIATTMQRVTSTLVTAVEDVHQDSTVCHVRQNVIYHLNLYPQNKLLVLVFLTVVLGILSLQWSYSLEEHMGKKGLWRKKCKRLLGMFGIGTHCHAN